MGIFSYIPPPPVLVFTIYKTIEIPLFIRRGVCKGYCKSEEMVYNKSVNDDSSFTLRFYK